MQKMWEPSGILLLQSPGWIGPTATAILSHYTVALQRLSHCAFLKIWRGVAEESRYTPSKGPVAPAFSALEGVSHSKLPLGRRRSTGACRSYTAACRATVGHLDWWTSLWVGHHGAKHAPCAPQTLAESRTVPTILTTIFLAKSFCHSDGLFFPQKKHWNRCLKSRLNIFVYNQDKDLLEYFYLQVKGRGAREDQQGVRLETLRCEDKAG